jgi:DNA-binding transcriptional LysR family regulator
MELRHLRYFVAIAEERSFTRAAERLWVAQPGLSTQMRRLEAELGVTLFERHTRGADLTGAGELFLERARAALAAADVAGATGRDLEAGSIGSLRVGIAIEARWSRASDVLQRFSRERPRVELTVLEAYGGTLWRDLRDGRVDALVAPRGHGSPDLRSLALGSEPWVVLIGTGHPLAGIGAVAAEDLDGEPIAVAAHRDGAALDRAIAELFEELQVAPEMMAAAPGPALHAAVARNEVLVLTTAPDALPVGVLARTLDPHRALAFELLVRDETPSPALAGFIELAAATVQHPATTRTLAAVA